MRRVSTRLAYCDNVLICSRSGSELVSLPDSDRSLYGLVWRVDRSLHSKLERLEPCWPSPSSRVSTFSVLLRSSSSFSLVVIVAHDADFFFFRHERKAKLIKDRGRVASGMPTYPYAEPWRRKPTLTSLR